MDRIFVIISPSGFELGELTIPATMDEEGRRTALESIAKLRADGFTVSEE